MTQLDYYRQARPSGQPSASQPGVTTCVEPRLIHAAVAEHARERPTTPAIVYGDSVLTYAALDAASDVYAARLRSRGVVAGDVVPVVLSRSARTIAVQLGIVKCGAAYAPIDPRWPAERRDSILAWLRPRVVVVTDHDEATGQPVLALQDEDVRDVAADAADLAEAVGSPDVQVDLEDPATVFFTSGTTGSPKAVVVPHRAVTRLFGRGGLVGFGPGECLTQAAPPAWDMYAFETWGALTTGSTSVLIDSAHMMPGDLQRSVAKHGVSTVWLTASLFNLFVDEDIDCFTGVQRVYSGGEKLSPRHVEVFLRRHPDIAMFNSYGPAENGMVTTIRRIVRADCAVPGGIPVGTPVPGTAVEIVNDAGSPCATDEVGEICASGLGLAHGYLYDPESTARQFRIMRIGGRDALAYRTGDLGLRDATGLVHYRGRADRQVKIRGHRIEPTEVENAAREQAGVRDAAVAPIEGADGAVSGLALFYVGVPATPADDGDPLDLAAGLRRTLPAYLVPSLVSVVESLPVTANGKLDRAQLGEMTRRLRRSDRVPAQARS